MCTVTAVILWCFFRGMPCFHKRRGFNTEQAPGHRNAAGRFPRQLLKPQLLTILPLRPHHESSQANCLHRVVTPVHWPECGTINITICSPPPGVSNPVALEGYCRQNQLPFELEDPTCSINLAVQRTTTTRGRITSRYSFFIILHPSSSLKDVTIPIWMKL